MTRATRGSGREAWDARLEAALVNPRDERGWVTSKSSDKVELSPEAAAAMTVNERLHAAGSLADFEKKGTVPFVPFFQILLSLINFPDGL